MPEIVLGIESSCDEMAAGIVRRGTEVLASVVQGQVDVHQPYGGVVPELASRDHVRTVSQVVSSALRQSGVNHLGDRAHVVARRELGTHAAVGLMNLDLPLDHAGEEFGPPANHRRSQLVAGALDTENDLGHRVTGQPRFRSIFSCSPLQSMQSSATGRASSRFTPISSPQFWHWP